MRNHRVLSEMVLGVLAAALAEGCDSQVGQDYRGEPLLTLRGSVVQNGENVEEFVPALGFYNMNAARGTDGFFVVDGRVSGSYPAQFQLDVMDVPPEQAMESCRGSCQMGVGLLFMVPRNHESSYPVPLSTEKFTADAGSPNTGTLTVSHCLGDLNTCDDLTYTCTLTPCPVVSSSGDSNLQNSGPPFGDRWTLGGGQTADATEYFDPNDVNHSYREVRVCNENEFVYPDGYAGSGELRRCTPTGEAPDASVNPLRDMVYFAQDYLVLYVSEDRPTAKFHSQLIPLTRGYNLLQLVPTPEDVIISAVNCEEDALIQAYVEANATNGTKCNPVLFVDQLEPAECPSDVYIALFDRYKELAAACPALGQYRRIDSPSSESLTIQLSRTPNTSY